MSCARLLCLYLWKNQLQKRRHWCATLCEVLTPLVFVGLMALLFLLSTLDVVPTQTFEDRTLPADFFPLTLLPKQLQMQSNVIAVSGPAEIVSPFLAGMDVMYPGLNFSAVFGQQYGNLDIPKFSSVVSVFPDDASIDQHVSRTDYFTDPLQIYAAISFISGPPHWNYAIRMNMSVVPSTQETTNDLQRGVDTSYQESYMSSAASGVSYSGNLLKQLAGAMPGFVPLQLAVDRYILNVTTSPTDVIHRGEDELAAAGVLLSFLNATVGGPIPTVAQLLQHTADVSRLVTASLYAPQHVTVTPFPIVGYRANNFYSVVDQVFSLFFMLTFLYPSFRLIRNLVDEKETRCREGMKMMGMTDLPLNTAWYITYGMVFLVIALGVALIGLAGIFSYSSFLLVLVYFFLFGMSAVSFSYLISAFFSRAKTAAILGTVVFTAAFFPYFAVSAITDTKMSKVLASLASPACFGLTLDAIAVYEAQGLGVFFSDMFVEHNNYSVGLGLTFLLLDSFIYTVLGWYMSNVWPSEYGIRQPLYFFLTSEYWRGYPADAAESRRRDGAGTMQPLLEISQSGGGNSIPDDGSEAQIEPVSAALRALEQSNRCIKIRRLTKEFQTPDGPKVAVNNLNLTMYESQIFVLLGHNGAGKTTTMSMLTGLISPTSGTANMYGMDIATAMPAIRRNMGVCPQHDVLFPELTVKEHLEFFAGLKGVNPDRVDQMVRDIIAEVGLVEKTNVWSSELSGGMKRKLSVAIALIGDSKIVFLDEPTSGMDPYSRRFTWNIIQNNREGRIIVLTTHFMDEADLLGDRIGIMADGTIRCLGSSHFLKDQYGVGYNLTLVKGANCDTNSLIEIVTSHVPDGRVLSNVGTELSFQLPFASSAAFPRLFEELETQQRSLGLQTYGVGVTTLEEVFLKVAREGNKQQQELTREMSSRLRSSSQASHHSDVEDGGIKNGAPSRRNTIVESEVAQRVALANRNYFWPHFFALLVKRARYTMRDRKAACFQLLIPILALLLGLLLLKSSTLSSEPPLIMSPLQFNPNRDGSGNLPLFDQIPYNASDDAIKVMGLIPAAVAQPLPVYNVVPAYYPHHPNPINSTVLLHALSEFLLDTRADMASSRYGAYVFDMAEIAGSIGYASYNLLQNTTAIHAVPIFINLANDALYKLSRNSKDVSITVQSHPLPLTAREEAIISTASSFEAVLLIVIAFAFIPASFAVFVVKEREVNAKHQQLISGVSIYAYWCSTFVWDIINYMVPCGLSLLIIYLFQIEELIEGNSFAATALLFIGYGCAVAPFTYVLTYLFRSHSTAQNVVLILNLLVFLLLIISFVLARFESTCRTNSILIWFFRLLPSFALGDGLLQLATIKILPFLDNDCGDIPFNIAVQQKFYPFDQLVAGRDLLYLLFCTFVYFALAVLIDVLLSYPWIHALILGDKNKVDPPVEDDEDVVAEMQRVDSGTDDFVQLRHLRKVYHGSKVAVRDLSFGIPSGQCFGFLGINGAGKTTTLKILSGDLVPTVGSASLGGFDILREQMKVRRLLGYCPQFDALLDLLTVREHLELFARIKGVGSDRLAQVVKEKLHQLQLVEFANKLAGTLSGGNKRKLSVAIAMIGDPPIMFLDEPSTGMDPVARRFMWDVIARMSTGPRGCSVILTTHSMEECEALCARVGIMVGGRLRCLGSIQHLKNRFGQGYVVEIKLKEALPEDVQLVIERTKQFFTGGRLPYAQLGPLCAFMGDTTRVHLVSPTGSGWLLATHFAKDGYVEEAMFASWWAMETRGAHLHHFMSNAFRNCELVERHDAHFRYKLPIADAPLSQLFRRLEESKTRLHIQEYSLSQTTLEQIFNVFAAQQEEEGGPVRGM